MAAKLAGELMDAAKGIALAAAGDNDGGSGLPAHLGPQLRIAASELWVPLLRRDASLLFDGSGGGHVSGAVSVRVTDALTGLTIPGARVRIDSLGLATDPGLDGRALGEGESLEWDTTSVPDGPHRLRVVGYRSGFVRHQVYKVFDVDVANARVRLHEVEQR